MKILWIGSAALVSLGVFGALTNNTTESLVDDSASVSQETVKIDGQEFPKAKDGRYKVSGVPTLFIDNSRVHTRHLTFNEDEKQAEEAPSEVQATATKFAETLKQTQEQAKERKKTLDELAE